MSRAHPLRLVLVPALLTLVVTVLRLVGQIQGWNPQVFGKPEVGGGGAILGISWLILVFGFWFGRRLRQGGQTPPQLGRAAGLFLAAALVGLGLMLGLRMLGVIWWPGEGETGAPRGSLWMVVSMWIPVAIALVAWRQAALTLLLYAVLARVPVLVVTWLCIQQGWETHYTKLPPGFPPVEGTELFFGLSFSQVVMWLPFTTVVGGLFACLGAATTKPQTGP